MKQQKIYSALLILLLAASFISVLTVFVPVTKAEVTTCGYTTVGSSTISMAGGASGSSYVYGRFQATTTGTTLIIRINTASTSVTGTKALVYTDNANTPNVLLGSSTAVTITGAGWITFTVTATTTSGSYYWLGLYVAAGQTFNGKYDATGAYKSYVDTTGAIPDPFPTTSGWQADGNVLSIYAAINDTSTVTAISANTTVLASNCLFSAYWSSTVQLTNYTFSWNNTATGTWSNDTAVTITGTISWTNITKNLGTNASMAGNKIGWQIYVNNSAANVVSTGIQTFIATLPVGGYVVAGPYYEDNGQVANREVNVTTRYTNGETTIHLLNGTTGSATLLVLNPALTPEYLSWEAIANFSYTRIYYLTNTTTASIKIFVPNIDSTAAIYQFTITDFYGMTNPYIASAIIVDGTLNQQQYILERKPLTVSTVSLVMEQWHSYTLIFSCDQGTYSQIFSAESTYLTNINILTGAFPASVNNGSVGLAYRINGTSIYASYVDGDNLTIWTTITITHYVGSVKLTDYTNNYTSFPITLTWTSAVNTTDYTATFLANRNGTIYTYTFTLPSLEAYSTNPFADIFDFLGTLTINGQTLDPGQLVAAFLIMCALAIGSVFSLEFGCVFAWIIGGVCIAMGWWQTGLPIFGLAGVTSIIIAIVEAKKTIREV